MTPEAEELKNFLDNKFVNYGKTFLSFVLLRTRTINCTGHMGGQQEEFVKGYIEKFLYKGYPNYSIDQTNSILEEVALEYGHDGPEWD